MDCKRERENVFIMNEIGRIDVNVEQIFIFWFVYFITKYFFWLLFSVFTDWKIENEKKREITCDNIKYY